MRRTLPILLALLLLTGCTWTQLGVAAMSMAFVLVLPMYIRSSKLERIFMEFLLAAPQHLEEMCRITQQAKTQLKNMGLDQWQKGYPSKEVWESDIAAGSAWLAVEENSVLGVFAFQTTPDVSYSVIDGAWLADIPIGCK